jgi:hypothetical protein
VRISPANRRRWLAWLFAASLAISAISLVGWCASYSRSLAIVSGVFELRLHKGCLCFTNGASISSGKKMFRLISEPMAAADPWPAFHTLRLNFSPADPHEVAFLGFNIVCRPTFDLIAVPLWAIIATMGIYQAWWLSRGRTIRRFSHECCLHCGYDLTGLIDSQRCPECGHRFNWGWAAPAPPATERARRIHTPSEAS